MNSARTELPHEVVPSTESAEPASQADRRKFDTRSELSDQVGTDTMLVRDGTTPRQVLLEQMANEEIEELTRRGGVVAESALTMDFAPKDGTKGELAFTFARGRR